MDSLPPELQDLEAIADPLERRLYFVALLSNALGPEGKDVVVVGGQALQFYTAGAYATADVDLVCVSRPSAVEVLNRWGFKREGRHWQQQRLELLVEIPDEGLAGDPARVNEIELRGLTLRIIGVEDLIADRLRAAVHWGSLEDRYWASNLLASKGNSLDWEYLRKQAERDGTGRLLTELEAQISA